MVPSTNHVIEVGHCGVIWVGWIIVLDKRALEFHVLILGAFFLDQICVSELKVFHLHLAKRGSHGVWLMDWLMDWIKFSIFQIIQYLFVYLASKTNK